MEYIEIEQSFKRVSNFLKCVVNSMCSEDYVWFPEAKKDEAMSAFDILTAIEYLDKAEPLEKIKILTKEE